MCLALFAIMLLHYGCKWVSSRLLPIGCFLARSSGAKVSQGASDVSGVAPAYALTAGS